MAPFREAASLPVTAVDLARGNILHHYADGNMPRTASEAISECLSFQPLIGKVSTSGGDSPEAGISPFSRALPHTPYTPWRSSKEWDQAANPIYAAGRSTAEAPAGAKPNGDPKWNRHLGRCFSKCPPGARLAALVLALCIAAVLGILIGHFLWPTPPRVMLASPAAPCLPGHGVPGSLAVPASRASGAAQVTTPGSPISSLSGGVYEADMEPVEFSESQLGALTASNLGPEAAAGEAALAPQAPAPLQTTIFEGGPQQANLGRKAGTHLVGSDSGRSAMPGDVMYNVERGG